MFFAQITDTLFDVTIPDSNIAKPAAMNITKNPQTKKRKVLKINPTSAETVVSAAPALLILSRKDKVIAEVKNFFEILNILLSPLNFK